MSPDVTSPFWDTLAAYFFGTLSGVQRIALERRISADPELAATVARIRRALAATEPPLDPAGAEAAMKRLRQAVEGYGGDVARVNTRTSASGRWRGTERRSSALTGQPLRRWVWYLGTTLALAGLVVVMNRHARLLHPAVGPMTASPSVYTTANGQRATVTLPDSSTVALNVASRLEVPADFAMGNHTVRLVGEGMFTVTHHQGTPFMVFAGRAAVRVLGTSFLVRHYTTDALTTVAVRDGKIAVGGDGTVAAHAIVLAAGKRALVGHAGVGSVAPVDPVQFGFVSGILTLKGVPFSVAARELGRWYDADIRIGDSALATRRVAGEYAAGSLSNLIEVLKMTYNVRIVRNGRVLTLFSR